MSINRVEIGGNLTRDVEVRKVGAGGTTLASFTVAVNRKYTVRGEAREEVAYIDCKAWGDVGAAIADLFSKGSYIVVRGGLRQETWDDKETGAKRSKLVVNVLEFDEPKPRAKQASGKSAAAAPVDDSEIPF